MMARGDLSIGLRTPAAVPLTPADVAGGGGAGHGGSAHGLPAGTANPKGHGRTNNNRVTNNNGRTTQSSLLTQANAKIRDGSAKLVEMKGWLKVIGGAAKKDEVSEGMRPGYLAELNKHLEAMTIAVEQRDHDRQQRCSYAHAADLCFDKSTRDFCFQRQVKSIFVFWLSAGGCVGTVPGFI